MKFKRLPDPSYPSLEVLRARVMSPMLQPPQNMDVAQAAEEYRKLDNPGSYQGPWDNQMAPYLVQPMQILTSLDHVAMIFVGPARTGKSDMFLNWTTHSAICDPADMMLIHMSQNTSRDYSNDDIAKLFRHSPDVGERVAKGGHNTHDVRFKTGQRLLIKWPSDKELSGKTIPRVWLMDYDRMDLDINGQGSAFDLGMKRTTTFGIFGMCVAESSPGREITDPKWMASTPHEAPPSPGIMELYNRGDRRRWYWKCEHCAERFEADFKYFVFDEEAEDFDDEASKVAIGCPHCGALHGPDRKRALNRSGIWLRDGEMEYPDGTLGPRPPYRISKSTFATFWLKGPAAVFQSWQNIVLSYLIARKAYLQTGDSGKLKSHYNLDRGEPFMPPHMAQMRMPEDVKGLRQDWGGTKADPQVHQDVRFLCAQIDVQAGGSPRFVVHVHGYTPTGDMVLIDYFTIRKSKRLDQQGHPMPVDPASYPEDWDLIVDQVLLKSYALNDGSGRRMLIKMTACDSGGKDGVTLNAYAFHRRLRDKGLFDRFKLVKGTGRREAPKYRESYPDNTDRSSRNSGARGDIPLITLKSDEYKDQLAGMMIRREPGGQYITPFWTEDFIYAQLTAETRGPNGWEESSTKSRKRNEATDLGYYGLGMVDHPSIRWSDMVAHRWDKPPAWAEEWDRNVMIIDPVKKKVEDVVVKSAPKTYDFAALGRQVA